MTEDFGSRAWRNAGSDTGRTWLAGGRDFINGLGRGGWAQLGWFTAHWASSGAARST